MNRLTRILATCIIVCALNIHVRAGTQVFYFEKDRVASIYVHDQATLRIVADQYGVLAEEHAAETYSSTLFRLTDQLGTALSTVDIAAATQSSELVDPFGFSLHSTHLAFEPILGFSGQMRDPESGREHFQAREYDSVVARFASIDPAADDFPTTTPYNYTLNNPLVLIDPDGRAPHDIHLFMNPANSPGSFGPISGGASRLPSQRGRFRLARRPPRNPKQPNKSPSDSPPQSGGAQPPSRPSAEGRVTVTDHGVGGDRIGVLKLNPDGSADIALTGRKVLGPSGNPIQSHNRLATETWGPVKPGERRLGFELQKGKVSYVSDSSTQHTPTKADVPRIQRALNRADLVGDQGTIVHFGGSTFDYQMINPMF